MYKIIDSGDFIGKGSHITASGDRFWACTNKGCFGKRSGNVIGVMAVVGTPSRSLTNGLCIKCLPLLATKEHRWKEIFIPYQIPEHVASKIRDHIDIIRKSTEKQNAW